MNRTEAVGTVLSRAGIERLKLTHRYHILDFMTPAPAQGVVAVTAQVNGPNFLKDILQEINHEPTAQLVWMERLLMRHLNAGCSSPLGIHAKTDDGFLYMEAVLLSPDGTQTLKANLKLPENSSQDALEKEIIRMSESLFEQGAKKLINEIRSQSNG
ncbi:unnamed protein product [Cyprideis torosa]|uniref:hydroxymethylbilane synthase n=1 Tax=Cyprideis torosa TaxID=163714 RepID=A0A7R8X1M0_9CRUS|nr:unnamed protein product [Cyprideis torosa]CAG0910437.1 unnamed protein product [Cyprideis torosa]